MLLRESMQVWLLSLLHSPCTTPSSHKCCIGDFTQYSPALRNVPCLLMDLVNGVSIFTLSTAFITLLHPGKWPLSPALSFLFVNQISPCDRTFLQSCGNLLPWVITYLLAPQRHWPLYQLFRENHRGEGERRKFITINPCNLISPAQLHGCFS